MTSVAPSTGLTSKMRLACLKSRSPKTATRMTAASAASGR